MSNGRAVLSSLVRPLPLLLLVSSVSMIVGLSQYLRAATYSYPVGDGAFIELYTLQATRGAWKLGPYSQFGWHHPGPLLFYLLAPLYRVSDARNIALAAGSSAINIACLAGLLWAVARWATPAVSGVVATMLGVYIWRVGALAASSWNPHIIVLPMGLLLMLCAGLASGRLRTLPAIVLVASFLMQTHVSTAPTVALVVGAALATALVYKPLSHAERASAPARSVAWWMNVSVWLLVLLWLPPLTEQLTGQPGNLSKLFAFFVTPSPGQPWSVAARAWADTIASIVSPTFGIPVGWALDVRGGGWSIAIAVAQVAALLGAGRWAIGRGERFEAALCMLGALASVASLWSITQITTTIGDYMVFWISIVGTINWAVLVGVVLSRVAEIGISRHRRLVMQATGLVSATAMMLLLIQGASQVKRGRDRALEPPVADARHVQIVSEALERDMREHGRRRPLMVISDTVWGEAAGVVLQLSKQGIHVVVQKELGWLYGEAMTPTGEEDSVFYIADAPRSQELSARPRDRVVIERGRVSVHTDPTPPATSR